MAGEIFISYRRADEAWARLLHAQLQAEGVEAWYDAHVGAGQDWRVATAKALQASRIFVLLFSQAASESEDIAKELAAATFSKKLVVPVRIENIQPTGAFLYELASRNWVNAYDNTEVKLAELAQSLAKLVKAGVVDESIIPFDRNAGAKTPVRKRSWLKRNPLVIAAAAIVIAAAAAALFWIYPRPGALVANFQPLPRPAGVSVAVLPFLNLSSDKEQEFFSDGITEEITSALAKVPGLNVVGRTSAFQFKGENKNLIAIGQALHATHLIEGSVRKAGNQVRITAQLIEADNGLHVWTESYDRNLTDIFAIQEDVASAIAGALQVPLGLKQGQSLVSNRTADTDSYQDYLRARELVRVRGFTNLTQAITLLEQVIARDPNYAPAWALLANVYVLMPAYSSTVSATVEEVRRSRNVYLPKAEVAARKAIFLDANNADAMGALGSSLAQRNNMIQAVDTYRQGLRLDPNNLIVLNFLAHDLSALGYLKESVAIWQKLNKLDPLETRFKFNLARILAVSGRYDAAVAIFVTLGNAYNAYAELATVYAAQGRFQEAADQLLQVPTGNFPVGMVESASRLLRSAPMQVLSAQNLPALTPPLQFVYLYVGAASRALHAGDRIWYPSAAPLRKSEPFKAYARDHGFLDYWRARGWPEFCHPVGTDDFACK